MRSRGTWYRTRRFSKEVIPGYDTRIGRSESFLSVVPYVRGMAQEPAFPRKAVSWFYFFLILLGILYYLSWSILFNTWDLTRAENTGVYALTIVLIGFGVTGYLLYRTPPKKAKAPESRQ